MIQPSQKPAIELIHRSVKIGKYCIVDHDVIIGEGTVVGEFVTITKGTKIGKNCFIGHYSIIENSHLKDNVIIQGRVRIGSRCTLDNDVEMKYNSILTSDAHICEKTFIGVGAVTLGSDVDGEQIPGTIIGQRCYIGGHSLITPGLNIPAQTILGANSFLKKILSSGTYVGNPAKKI